MHFFCFVWFYKLFDYEQLSHAGDKDVNMCRRFNNMVVSDIKSLVAVITVAGSKTKANEWHDQLNQFSLSLCLSNLVFLQLLKKNLFFS